MINPHYELGSGYHDGSPVEQDVKAWLGRWKTIENVPERHCLNQYADVLDADTAWDEFVEEYGQDWSDNVRKYQYGKGWREWTAFCQERDIHPLCPVPEDIAVHLDEQRAEASSDQTLHQTRFRPLCRLFEFLRYHVDYPHRYNPWLMAVLEGGGAEAAWGARIEKRIKRYEAEQEVPADDV